MARKCTGWVPVAYQPHADYLHLPVGSKDGRPCRKCWVPCRNKTDDGVYCEECLDRLSTYPRAVVRRSLAMDSQAPSEILAFLTQDLDQTVAIAAQDALADRGVTDVEIEELLARDLVDLGGEDGQAPEDEGNGW